MSDDDRCGAETTGDHPCKNPAGENGRCWIPSHNPDSEGEDPNGRPSKFERVKNDLLEAADGYINLKQVANKGGVSRSTLYKYLDEHEDFSDSFKRARGEAADRLVHRALDPDDEIDVTFARFLLERSFKFIKTERQEVNLDADHSFDASEGVTAEFVSYEEVTNGSQ
ncbi:MAG: hypothetical protein ACOCY1_04675 [Halovenus sp.]